MRIILLRMIKTTVGLNKLMLKKNALGSNKTTKEKRKRHKSIDDDNDNGILSNSICSKNQSRMVKCTKCDLSNPQPEVTEKVNRANINCDFFPMHRECKNVMKNLKTLLLLTVQCSFGFKFLKKQQYGSKALIDKIYVHLFIVIYLKLQRAKGSIKKCLVFEFLPKSCADIVLLQETYSTPDVEFLCLNK